MVYGEDIDINAVGAATIDAADVLSTRKGISYAAAVALIENDHRMMGPFASPEARNRRFNIVAHALLNELDQKTDVPKPLMAGMPWIVGLLLLTMVIRKKGR